MAGFQKKALGKKATCNVPSNLPGFPGRAFLYERDENCFDIGNGDNAVCRLWSLFHVKAIQPLMHTQQKQRTGPMETIPFAGSRFSEATQERS